MYEDAFEGFVFFSALIATECETCGDGIAPSERMAIDLFDTEFMCEVCAELTQLSRYTDRTAVVLF